MLDVFRKKAKIIIYITAFVFIVGMAIMGISGLFDQRRDTHVGEIAGEKITYQQYTQWFRNQLQSFTQENPDQELDDATVKRINDQTWQQLVQMVLFDQEVKRRRIRIRDEDVIDKLKNDPPQFIRESELFYTNGRFDREKYLNTLITGLAPNGEPLDLSWLEGHVRDQLPYELLLEQVRQEVQVTEEDAREDFSEKNNKATGKVIHFDQNKVKGVEVSDEEIATHYEENKEDFKKAPGAKYKYVRFEIKPSEQDEAEVAERIISIEERIKTGEDFAELAREYSEDPSNAEKGGDLGFFGRGRMVPEFEERAFNMNVGQVSEPVKTQFGWHIIKVTDTRTNEEGEKEVQASHILLRTEASERTKMEFEDKAREFQRLVKKDGIEPAAEKMEYNVQESGIFEENATFIQGVGRFEDLVEFGFNNRVEAVPEVKEAMNGDFYVLQLAERLPERFDELETVKPRIRTTLERKKKVAEAIRKAHEFQEKYEPSQYLANATREGWEIVEAKDVTIDRSVPGIGKVEELNEAMLAAEDGEFTSVIEGERGAYIALVEERQHPDMEEFEENRDKLIEELKTREQSQHVNEWYRELMEEAEIVDNREMFF
jgi:peptidyl-prolyl cis-trans isomerase D